ncbi:streptococcal hemagglutinin-like [Dermacentor albipictus]|uniref:streptococcal hemagglutinin-like n=1 Tax=Dermacentor albipictus TaxID=60249 RepID=UPI0038FC057C
MLYQLSYQGSPKFSQGSSASGHGSSAFGTAPNRQTFAMQVIQVLLVSWLSAVVSDCSSVFTPLPMAVPCIGQPDEMSAASTCCAVDYDGPATVQLIYCPTAQWTTASITGDDLSSRLASVSFSGHGSSAFGTAPNRQTFAMQVIQVLLVPWLSAVVSDCSSVFTPLPMAVPCIGQPDEMSAASTCCAVDYDGPATVQLIYCPTAQWTTASITGEDLSSRLAGVSFSGHGSSAFGTAPNRQTFAMQVIQVLLVPWLSAVVSDCSSVFTPLPMAVPCIGQPDEMSAASTCCAVDYDGPATVQLIYCPTAQWTTASITGDDLSSRLASVSFSGHGSSAFGTAPNRQTFAMQVIQVLLVPWLSAVVSDCSSVFTPLPMAVPCIGQPDEMSVASTCCAVDYDGPATVQLIYCPTAQWTTASITGDDLSSRLAGVSFSGHGSSAFGTAPNRQTFAMQVIQVLLVPWLSAVVSDCSSVFTPLPMAVPCIGQPDEMSAASTCCAVDYDGPATVQLIYCPTAQWTTASITGDDLSSRLASVSFSGHGSSAFGTAPNRQTFAMQVIQVLLVPWLSAVVSDCSSVFTPLPMAVPCIGQPDEMSVASTCCAVDYDGPASVQLIYCPTAQWTTASITGDDLSSRLASVSFSGHGSSAFGTAPNRQTFAMQVIQVLLVPWLSAVVSDCSSVFTPLPMAVPCIGQPDEMSAASTCCAVDYDGPATLQLIYCPTAQWTTASITGDDLSSRLASVSFSGHGSSAFGTAPNRQTFAMQVIQVLLVPWLSAVVSDCSSVFTPLPMAVPCIGLPDEMSAASTCCAVDYDGPASVQLIYCPTAQWTTASITGDDLSSRLASVSFSGHGSSAFGTAPNRQTFAMQNIPRLNIDDDDGGTK